jgi:hypothetical protein
MNKQQTSRLFIANTSNGFDFLVLPETHKLYPRLIAPALRQQLKNQEDREILGRTLIVICQHAQAAHQVEVMREVSEFLMSLPVRKEFRLIGLYYQAWVLVRTGQLSAAQVIFEQLATHSRFPWKSRAILSVGTCHEINGELDTATASYLEAHRAAADTDVLVALKSQWMISAIRNVQGDHDYAVTSLENQFPLVRYVAKIYPAIYHDYLNSLAVRHTALGHFNEAERLCDIALSSPFARNFPNWAETREEIFAAKDAAAATVYVNIEPTSEPKQEVIEQLFNPCAPATDPEIGVAINELVGTNEDRSQSTLENALSDSPLPEVIADSSVEPETNPEPQPNNSLKISFAIILSSLQRRTSALAPTIKIGLQAPLFLSDAVPNNHRPRAPPHSLRLSRSQIIIFDERPDSD